jgi:hypothetical protein
VQKTHTQGIYTNKSLLACSFCARPPLTTILYSILEKIKAFLIFLLFFHSFPLAFYHKNVKLKTQTYQKGIFMYYNYHAQAKRLITSGDLKSSKIVKNYNGISPALVLSFFHHRPMPIREYRWQEYFDLIETKKDSN